MIIRYSGIYCFEWGTWGSSILISYSLFTYRLTIKFVNFALSINVAIQNHGLANTNAKIKLLTIASLIYNRHQYPWCVHNCEREEKEKEKKTEIKWRKRKFSSGAMNDMIRYSFFFFFLLYSFVRHIMKMQQSSWITTNTNFSLFSFSFTFFNSFTAVARATYALVIVSGSNVSITIDEHQIPWQQFWKRIRCCTFVWMPSLIGAEIFSTQYQQNCLINRHHSLFICTFNFIWSTLSSSQLITFDVFNTNHRTV